jgi:hypothetical protein
MNLKKAISMTVIGAASIAMGLGVQFALAGTWTAAPSNPPANNVAGPLTADATYQAKSGGLTLGSSNASSSIPLDVEGIAYMRAAILGQNSGSTFQYLDGNQASGKVLTSDASGNATWQTLAAASSSSSVGWVTIDSGGVIYNAGTLSPFGNIAGVGWNSGGPHDPQSMCVRAGYTNATGAIKDSYGGYLYYGNVMYSGNPASGRSAGSLTNTSGPPGNFTYATLDAQILCAK